MKLIRPLDCLIILIVLVIGIAAVFLFRGTTGAKAEVYVNKRKTAVFSLSGPESIKEIDTQIGKIRLEIGNGSIRVLQSPCNQRICILQGAIHHTHENIICLPARMVISITGPEDADNPYNQIDAISH